MSHIENTAADKSSAGFKYQDFVYVYGLLYLEPNQEMGLEIYDDIHKCTHDGLSLIQVKHSLGAGNLTDRDIDLWKTLYNWHMSKDEIPQEKELSLILYTNKKIGNQKLIQLFLNPSKNKKDIYHQAQTILNELEQKELEKKSSAKIEGKEPPNANPILKYIRAIATANDTDIYFLLDRFQIHTNDEEIIKKIDNKLATFAIPEQKIKSTRNELVGAISIYAHERVQRDSKTLISYNCLRKEIGFDRIIQLAISLTTDFEIYYDRFNEIDHSSLSFNESIFSLQLKDLGMSKSEIIDHGIEMVLTEEVIAELKLGGYFSDKEDSRLETKVKLTWKDFHTEAHDIEHHTNENHVNAAKKCLNNSRRKDYFSGDRKLPSEMGSGKLIKLSNKPDIGWLSDWEERYKK